MSTAQEAARQHALLQALRAPALGSLPPAALALPGRADSATDVLAGLRAYRANLQAVAARALSAAYPVLARLVGDEAMAALARDLLLHHPPTRGDLAWFGAELAPWIAKVPELAELPYLADVARLEWAAHCAHTASDPVDAPPDLQALASEDPQALRVHFVAGSALIASAWPVLPLWRAHQVPPEIEPELAPVRAAFAVGEGSVVWVWRRGHRVELAHLDAGEHALHDELLGGRSLGTALATTLDRHPAFSFEHWLTRALREGWLAEIRPDPNPT